MKTLTLALLILTIACDPAFAQTSLLPTLEAVRAEYPADWSHEQRGQFLNKVAWIHRAEGWGLLHKPGGNRCPTPQQVDVSCDYLVYRPTLQGYDVLADENTPVFNLGDSFVGQPERWIPPVAPAGSQPPPVPPTEPPAPVGDVLTEVRAVKTIAEQARELAAEAVREIKAHREGVSREYYKWAAILGPIVTGIIAYFKAKGGDVP